MDTLFTKIIKGEIPSYKIAEDEHYYAFLDINPLKPGHTLVVPKLQNDYIFDLDDDTLAGLMLFAKKVALAIQVAIPCNRVGVAVVGIEVPHTHVHLVPINAVNDMNFSNPHCKLSHEEFVEIAHNISSKVQL